MRSFCALAWNCKLKVFKIDHPLIESFCRIMRPNTPHVVFTVESSVCRGGHFYAASTIRDSCYGMMHCFTSGTLVTNADHTSEAFALMGHMVVRWEQHFLGFKVAPKLGKTRRTSSISPSYYHSQTLYLGMSPIDAHIPKLNTWDGVLDMVTVSCLMELGNVLCDWCYKTNDHQERRRLMYTRKLCRSLLMWTFDNYSLHDPAGKEINPLAEFYWPYLAQQARTLASYKAKATDAEYSHLKFNELMSPAKVKRAIEDSIRQPDLLWDMYKASSTVNFTFAWTNPPFEVCARPHITPGTFHFQDRKHTPLTYKSIRIT